MPLAALLWSVVTFVINEILIKFLVLAALFAVIVTFMPLLLSALDGMLPVAGLNSAFGLIPSGVWFWLDFFAFDLGVPLLISAHVTRFVIRRIPVIG